MLSFQGTDSAYRLFQKPSFNRPTPLAGRPVETGRPLKTPGFLVRRESAFHESMASLKALLTRTKIPYSTSATKYIYRNASLTGFKAPGLGFFESLVLHVGLILAILFAPMILPTRTPALSTSLLPPEVIYYPVPERKVPVHLPRIAPKGPGGRPGSGIRPTLPPEPGKTASNADLKVISKPLHPDNVRQTIIQPAAPPDLRIPNDIKLPNLSLGTLEAPKKPTFDLNLKKPMQENAKVAADMATPKAETNTDFTIATALQPTTANPKLPIPVGSMSKPVQYARSNSGANSSSGAETPDVGAAGYGRAVLAIGVDPAQPGAPVALPPGNRWGDFSIAPGSGKAGSPGGKANGAPGGGGNNGNGRAGDESVGIGSGHDGGGGGKDGGASRISVQGTGNSVGGYAALDPHIEAKTIYPVIGAAMTLPKNHMLVSAGPMGGGGLGVYGALPCAKIYTIYLPMTGGGWTMQYCQKVGSADASAKEDPKATVIRLETGLLPPDVDWTSRYDFKRVPVPQGKEQKLIVLKGTLNTDGNVDTLQVYQGVVPQMDDSARAAFSRWKFKPAKRDGKPVALEILVGIPTDSGRGGDAQ